jgi:hypothetical protein
LPAGDGHLSACWLLDEGHKSSASLGQGITPGAATIAAAEATVHPARRSAGSRAGEDMPGTEKGR